MKHLSLFPLFFLIVLTQLSCILRLKNLQDFERTFRHFIMTEHSLKYLFLGTIYAIL